MELEKFVEWLKEQGKRERTQEGYQGVVKALAKWYEERTDQPFDPDQVTARDLQDWISHMQTVQRLAPATVNQRVAALKTYWSFLVEAGHSTLDPTKPIRMKRISALEQAPRWLTRKQQADLIHQVRKEKNPWKRARNLAICQLMLQAGLRISEVAALDVADIDWKRRIVTVWEGKGGKTRRGEMNPDLVRAFEGWREEREEVADEAFFISSRGRDRMTRQGIHYLIRRYLDAVGLSDYSAHSLRHSFCRNLIDAGQPLQVVSQLAGHESLETTRRYVTPSEHDRRRAVDSISEEKA